MSRLHLSWGAAEECGSETLGLAHITAEPGELSRSSEEDLVGQVV